jgi:predicted  nucleic acid-binding Zn-ribbon protein
MTYQSGLERTLDDLEEDSVTIQGLADLLRKAVLASDGISVEGFVSKVKAMEADYYSRWDQVKKYPEGGRGIEKPWKNGVGTILKAFYEKEELRIKFENAVAYETALDRLNREITALTASVTKRDTYYQANQKIVEDINKRRTFKAEEELAAGKMKELKQTSSTWPVLEKDITDLEPLITGLQTQVQALTKEKEAAQTAEKNKALQEQYNRAREKKGLFDAAEDDLASVPKLDRPQLDQIQKVQQRLEKISAGISAGKLVVAFKPKQDITVKVQRDLELAQETALAAGESYQVKAGGRLAIEYAGLEMEITSGEGSFEETRRKHEQCENDLKAVLLECQVTSLEQAQSIHGEYESRLEKVKKARAIYESELQGVSFEDLELKVREAGAGTVVRPLAEIIPDLMKTQTEITQKEKDIAARRTTLAEYKAKYVSQDNLLDELLKVRQKEQDLQKEIAGLSPLPPEVTDLNAFQNKYDENLSLLNEEEGKLKKVQLEQAEKVGAAPEDTSEDLKGLFDENEKSFKAALRKGEAIARINVVAQQVLGDAGNDIYGELGKDLERITSIITDKKYAGVKMDQSIPEGCLREDGQVVDYDLLSHGTKDMVGLALRLAIAKHFLSGSKGFLAMDDPLVNMDPTRQQKAAEVIKDYAAEKQVLIFTCHPGHAEMLGGNKIEL